MNEPTYERMLITPTMALDWLSDPRISAANRRLEIGRGQMYARQMMQGQWRFTCEPIKFDEDGRLVDGQHRLYGVVESGMPMDALVVRGVPNDAHDVMDTGRPRRASDVLGIHGFANVTSVAAAAKILVLMERGLFEPSMGSGRMMTSNLDVLAYVEKHDDLASVAVGITSYRRPCPPSVYLASLVLMTRVDAEAANTFDAGFTIGAELKPGNPILTLRERLNQAQASRERLSQYVLVSGLLRAWNHWRADQHMMRFPLFSNGGAIPIPDRLR